MKQFDVLGIGTAAVDDLIFVQHYPAADSKVDILSSQRQGGGQTATAMVAAARLGARAAFCCQLGDDDLSDFTLRELEKEGVHTGHCVRTPDGNPYHSLIIVDSTTHSRTILHSGGNICPPPEIITEELISSTKVLCLDDNSRGSGIKAARLANEINIPVVADIEPDPPPEFEELIPFVNHLVINREFGNFLTGLEDESQMASELSAGRTCCVITAGERGCWYAIAGGSTTRVPAFAVEVVDTTGCGDVFHGAYAAAIANGNEIRDAVRLASATAAMKARHPGGRLGIPSLTLVKEFLLQNS